MIAISLHSGSCSIRLIVETRKCCSSIGSEYPARPFWYLGAFRKHTAGRFPFCSCVPEIAQIILMICLICISYHRNFSWRQMMRISCHAIIHKGFMMWNIIFLFSAIYVLMYRATYCPTISSLASWFKSSLEPSPGYIFRVKNSADISSSSLFLCHLNNHQNKDLDRL